MADGSKLEKSTGYTPPTGTASGSELAQAKSTAEKKASPVYPNAPTKDASLTSIPEVSPSEILAVQVVMGDFKEIKNLMPKSWQASSNGRLYFCVQSADHQLSFLNGELLVDGKLAGRLLEKLLEE